MSVGNEEMVVMDEKARRQLKLVAAQVCIILIRILLLYVDHSQPSWPSPDAVNEVS